MRSAPDKDLLEGHTALLLDSYRRLLGTDLVPPGRGAAQRLYESDIVVVSHGTAADPVFNYANLAAQRLFELDWDAFLATPSRYSAEPLAREERQRLLARVTRDGYIADYAGVRISSSGKRFRIEQAVVWNLTAANGAYAGQAAAFSHWTMLEAP